MAFEFTPANGYEDAVTFPDPPTEAAARTQVMNLHRQMRDAFNEHLADKVHLINVENYGAKGNGTTDDTVAIQSAIDAANDGDIIYFPSTPASYKCLGSFIINKKIWLRGESRAGVQLDVYSTVGNGFIEVQSKFVSITDISFYYPEQVRTNLQLAANGGVPVTYPYTIYGSGHYCTYERLNMGNAFRAIRIGIEGVYSGSSVTIKDIIGTPLNRGLVLDSCRDIPKIQNIHWNRNIYLETPKELESDIWNYIKNNAYAFWFGRVDFGTCIQLFGYGYKRGILLQTIESPGSADKLHFESCQFDKTLIPLWLQNFQSVAVFSKCVFIGDGSDNIIVNGQGTTENLVIFNECVFNNFDARVMVLNSNSIINSCTFTNWAKNGGVWDAISATTAGTTHKLTNTLFDAGTATNARAFFNNDIDMTVIVNGCTFKNVNTQGAVRVGTTGKLIEHNNILSGSQNRNPISFTKETQIFKGTTAPTSGTYLQGDEVINTTPTELGTSGSKYIVDGWRCITSGTPGVWKEKRTLSGG